MGLDDAKNVVRSRIEERGQTCSESKNPHYLELGDRTLWVCASSDGFVQFPEVEGTGTGIEALPGKFHAREGDLRFLVAVVDESETAFVFPMAIVRDYADRVDGRTWRVRLDDPEKYRERWDLL